MKKIYYILFVLFAGIGLLFVGCGDDEENNGYTPEVIENPVTGITITNASADGIVLADVGATETVQVSATPANAGDAERYHYVYTSSDQSIFTVSDEGVVTATGTGEAYLTVIPKNNAALKANCKVTVVGIKVTAIEIAAAYQTRTLARTNAAGPSFEMAAQITVSPANASIKRVQYTSSNPEVATVSEDGTVTAVWVGTTTIRVAATDKSGVYADAEITVTITPITSITFNTLSFNAVSSVITVGATSGTLHVNDVLNLVNTAENPGFTLSCVTGTTANSIRYQPTTATRNTFNFTSSNEAIITVAPTGTSLVATPTKGGAGTATISIDAADGHGAHAELAIIMHKEIVRTNWTIVAHSPDGTITSGADEFGGPIANVIKDGGSAGLVKSDTYNNSPQGITDSYFTIDLGTETTFDYFIISDAYCGSINSYVKTNRISLYGSHDGTSFSTVQDNITKSVSTYGVPIRLNASHTYRYVKVLVWNTGTTATYKNQSHYVIDNFRLASATQ
jgi:uncharacterized protein YjdB